MREAGLLPGIVSPTRGSIDSHSTWLTQPITYAQLTYLFRSGLAASSAHQPTATFNSLRRVLPSLGNCLGLDDQEMQSISNWQEVVKAPGGSHMAKASFPMGRHYAEGKHESSAWLKGRMLEAFRVMALRRLTKLRDRAPYSSSARILPAGSWTWSDLREEVQAHARSCTEPHSFRSCPLAQRYSLPALRLDDHRPLPVESTRQTILDSLSMPLRFGVSRLFMLHSFARPLRLGVSRHHRSNNHDAHLHHHQLRVTMTKTYDNGSPCHPRKTQRRRVKQTTSLATLPGSWLVRQDENQVEQCTWFSPSPHLGSLSRGVTISA